MPQVDTLDRLEIAYLCEINEKVGYNPHPLRAPKLTPLVFMIPIALKMSSVPHDLK